MKPGDLDDHRFYPGPVPLGSKPAIQRAVDAYTRALLPVAAPKFFEMMAVLFTAFPPQRLSEAEQRARMKLYHQELGDLPHDILEVALRQVVRTCRFFPSIAEIRTVAEDMVRARRLHRYRLTQLLDQPERQPDLSAEEEAAVSAELAALVRTLTERDRRERDAERARQHEARIASDPHYAAVHSAAPYRPTTEAVERARRLGLIPADAPAADPAEPWY